MSILNTRFNRWAQVIARDGMYAGFAGAKTGHRRVALGEAAVIPFLISLPAPLASARWCDQSPTPIPIWRFPTLLFATQKSGIPLV